MTRQTLAKQLRQAQEALGQVPQRTIQALSDEEIIDCYITCNCCGVKQVNKEQLATAIYLAENADAFFEMCKDYGTAIH